MKLSVFVEIEKPIEEVWKTIIDFKNCTNFIESIINLEIIEQPKDTLIGFKWKENRIMFGKEATETMWITDYTENEFYQTKAESHGSIYISRLSVERIGENTKLTMTFSAEPQTFFVKVFSFCLGFLLKGSMKKALLKDLNDIKRHLESK
jgi:uncharacterized membrane protein